LCLLCLFSCFYLIFDRLTLESCLLVKMLWKFIFVSCIGKLKFIIVIWIGNKDLNMSKKEEEEEEVCVADLPRKENHFPHIKSLLLFWSFLSVWLLGALFIPFAIGVYVIWGRSEFLLILVIYYPLSFFLLKPTYWEGLRKIYCLGLKLYIFMFSYVIYHLQLFNWCQIRLE